MATVAINSRGSARGGARTVVRAVFCIAAGILGDRCQGRGPCTAAAVAAAAGSARATAAAASRRATEASSRAPNPLPGLAAVPAAPGPGTPWARACRVVAAGGEGRGEQAEAEEDLQPEGGQAFRLTKARPPRPPPASAEREQKL
eukprot:6214562-Alexandrium_andersonii.AAC.1